MQSLDNFLGKGRPESGESIDCLLIVKEFFPDVDDNMAGYILWNHTGFPSFFYEPVEEYLRKQLKDYKDALQTDSVQRS